MSMSSSTLSRAERNYYRIRGALLFSHYVQQRRHELGLSVEQAAYEACLEVSEWCALEGGHVPADDDPVLHSIAETLEAHYLKVSLYAEISRYNQSLPV
jgi:Helix-turn-helix domain